MSERPLLSDVLWFGFLLPALTASPSISGSVPALPASVPRAYCHSFLKFFLRFKDLPMNRNKFIL